MNMPSSYFRLVLQVLCICLIPCACSRPILKSGNFTDTFLQTVQAYGGKVKQSTNLPVIDAQWSLEKDANGFEFQVSDTSFPRLEGMVMSAFGQEGEGSLQPVRSRLFTASSVGVALTMHETAKGVQINCLKGMTNFSPLPRR
jgi:hypothetical protein